MLLSSLIGADAAAPAGSGNVEVAGITSDSRDVRPGSVFAAIAGTKADGARFISDAVAKGAVAILTSQDTEVAGVGDVPVLRAEEPRRALALMAARFYGLQQPQTAVGCHRHQRQDLGRRFHAADLRGAGAQQRLARHHRPGQERQRASMAR